MKHIDITSQLVRHQMLMDLAKMVKEHLDKNPGPHPYEEPETEPPPLIHYYQSSK